jgi:hypothetical protein
VRGYGHIQVPPRPFEVTLASPASSKYIRYIRQGSEVPPISTQYCFLPYLSELCTVLWYTYCQYFLHFPRPLILCRNSLDHSFILLELPQPLIHCLGTPSLLSILDSSLGSASHPTKHPPHPYGVTCHPSKACFCFLLLLQLLIRFRFRFCFCLCATFRFPLSAFRLRPSTFTTRRFPKINRLALYSIH